MYGRKIKNIKFVIMIMLIFCSTLFFATVLVAASFNTLTNSGFELEYITEVEFTAQNFNTDMQQASPVKIEFGNDPLWGTSPYESIKQNSTLYANYYYVDSSSNKVNFNAYLYLNESGEKEIYLITNALQPIYAPINCGRMFKDLTTVKCIVLNNFNTSNVTNMMEMFNNCSSLTSLDLSGKDVSNVTTMHSMFGNCSSLTSVNLSNLNAKNVTTMHAMFNACSNLKDINLTGFKTEAVTNLSYMFYGCKNIDMLDLTGFNTANVVGVAFSSSNYETLSTGMHLMFTYCENLKTICIDPTLWQTTQVEGHLNMFAYCYGLVGGEGTIYNDNIVDKTYARGDSGTTSPGYLTVVASLSENLMSKIITAAGGDINNVQTIVLDKFNSTYNAKINGIIPVDVSATETNVINLYAVLDSSTNKYDIYILSELGILANKDCSYMFSDNASMFPKYNTSLTSVTFGSNFYTNHVTNMSSMFRGCSALTSITYGSNFNTSNVTDMSYMFYNCKELTSLDLRSFDTRKVTDMNNMFSYCKELTSLDLSSFDTTNVTDMSYMFYNCSNDLIDSTGLTSITFGNNFNTSKVTNMSYMFYDCVALANLDLSRFDTTNVTNMSYMFYMCKSLTSLDLSNFNTSKVTDMSHMFDMETQRYYYSERSKLTSLDLSSFDTSNVTNMSYMFYCCEKLTSLDLSSFDTRNVTDMSYMFSGYDDPSDYSTFEVKMQLVTIYVNSNTWGVDQVETSEDMFFNCFDLVGGAGTVYDSYANSSYRDKTRAHVDGGTANPGYLTAK